MFAIDPAHMYVPALLSLQEVEKGKKLAEANTQTLKHRGKMIRGILLGPEHGVRSGCIEIGDFDMKALNKNKEYGNSTEDGMDVVEAATKHVNRQLATSISNKKVKDADGNVLHDAISLRSLGANIARRPTKKYISYGAI